MRTGIKIFSLLCWAHGALWDRKGAPSLKWQSFLHFFTQLLVLFGSKFHYSLKGEKMMRENKPLRLTFDSWCSLSLPQCAAAYREN